MKTLIVTDYDKCISCNKCVKACPIQRAHVVDPAAEFPIRVQPEFCTLCGNCIKRCPSKARTYVDDTQDFFDEGLCNSASVIADPAFKINYPNYKKIITWLKSKGVNKVYDGAVGSEIAAWAYYNYMKKNPDNNALIPTNCLVAIYYIEKFVAEIVDYIIPVQSPMMCNVVYVKKYMKNNDKLAYLSPCIAQKVMIDSEDGVDYNITLQKLGEYFKENKIDIDSLDESEFDTVNITPVLGDIMNTPNGLREIMRYLTDDNEWVRAVEGTWETKDYLDQMTIKFRKNQLDIAKQPKFVNALNCKYGCSQGTGCAWNLDMNDKSDKNAYKIKRSVYKTEFEGGAKYPLFDQLDKELDASDFKGSYSKDVGAEASQLPQDSLESGFEKLKKGPDERNINCSACGYASCTKMATAIARGLNVPESCVYYMRKISG